MLTARHHRPLRSPAHPVRTALAWTLPLALLLAAAGFTRTWHDAEAIQAHWASERLRSPVAGELLIVALGDSAMQGIGATGPEMTLAGRTESHLETTTGRSVIVHNYASGGATVADILATQLPAASREDLPSADVVLVSTSNDLEQRTGTERYAADLALLAGALDPRRTVISDLPPEPGRRAYQDVLERITDAAGIGRADFAHAVLQARRADIFSWLPPHLNDRGYGIWFRAVEPVLSRLHHPSDPPQART